MKRGEWRLQKTSRKEEKVESNQQEKSLQEKVGVKKKPVKGPEDLVKRRRIPQPGKNPTTREKPQQQRGAKASNHIQIFVPGHGKKVHRKVQGHVRHLLRN